MKRNAFKLGEAIVITAVIAILAVILFPVLARRNEPHRDYCQSNLKNIALGIKQYIQDSNDKYPPAKVAGAARGWVEVIEPYVKSFAIYRCPRAEKRRVVHSRNEERLTDYWYNRNLAGIEEGKMGDSATLFLLGDGNSGTSVADAQYILLSLPASWVDDGNSPLYRHDGRANYAFLDGHVKGLTPQEILAKPDSYRFRIK